MSPDLPPGILGRFKTTEIQGRSKTGKSALVAFLLMTFLLPDRMTADYTRPKIGASSSARRSSISGSDSLERITLDVNVGGRGPGRRVLLFDTDGRFDLARLQRMLVTHCRGRINEAARRSDAFANRGTLPWQPPSDDELRLLANRWMGKLQIWRPRSTAQLALAIRSAQRTSGPAEDTAETGAHAWM